jgi:arginine exporter protein ArgO
MSSLAQTSVQRRWRHLFGLMLCSLLFFFAVGAKTALYHPQQDQVKTLISTKVWQNTAVPPAISSQVAKAPVLLYLAVLLMATFAVTRLIPIEQSFVRASRWFSPSLSVRPPPSL